MYDEKQHFVDNPIQRYAIGGLGSLAMNEDSSLNIYIQHESMDAGKEMNWLSAPAGVFNIFIRLYSPDQAVLDGTGPSRSCAAFHGLAGRYWDMLRFTFK